MATVGPNPQNEHAGADAAVAARPGCPGAEDDPSPARLVDGVSGAGRLCPPGVDQAFRGSERARRRR